jgi:hypothetical protein
MTQNEIIEMAREAGVWTDADWVFADILNPKIEAFAKLVAAKAMTQRTWVGLTDEEVMEVWEKIKDGDWAIDFYDVIEAKLKEKNT